MRVETDLEESCCIEGLNPPPPSLTWQLTWKNLGKMRRKCANLAKNLNLRIFAVTKISLELSHEAWGTVLILMGGMCTSAGCPKVNDSAWQMNHFSRRMWQTWLDEPLRYWTWKNIAKMLRKCAMLAGYSNMNIFCSYKSIERVARRRTMPERAFYPNFCRYKRAQNLIIHRNSTFFPHFSGTFSRREERRGVRVHTRMRNCKSNRSNPARLLFCKKVVHLRRGYNSCWDTLYTSIHAFHQRSLFYDINDDIFCVKLAHTHALDKLS